MSKIRTHYDNLKVARNAPEALIKAAYKVLLQQHHPDKVEVAKQAEALRITHLIRGSYDVLSDPVQRAEHDAWIKAQETQSHSHKPDINVNEERDKEDLKRRAAEQARREEDLKRREAEQAQRKSSDYKKDESKKPKNEDSKGHYYAWRRFWALILSWKFVTAMAILLSILLLGGDFSPWWAQKAAEQGDAVAQNHLGAMYANGDGVAKNNYLAFQWYQKAAEQGNAFAQNNLGAMYAHGDGVAKNNYLAVQWIQKAAEQGNVAAQNNLGAMYGNGDGVAKNNYLAVKWFQKAAEQGSAFAQNNLDRMYAKGDGVAKK